MDLKRSLWVDNCTVMSCEASRFIRSHRMNFLFQISRKAQNQFAVYRAYINQRRHLHSMIDAASHLQSVMITGSLRHHSSIATWCMQNFGAADNQCGYQYSVVHGYTRVGSTFAHIPQHHHELVFWYFSLIAGISSSKRMYQIGPNSIEGRMFSSSLTWTPSMNHHHSKHTNHLCEYFKPCACIKKRSFTARQWHFHKHPRHRMRASQLWCPKSVWYLQHSDHWSWLGHECITVVEVSCTEPYYPTKQAIHTIAVKVSTMVAFSGLILSSRSFWYLEISNAKSTFTKCLSHCFVTRPAIEADLCSVEHK